MDLALIGNGYWGKNYFRLLEQDEFFNLKFVVDNSFNNEKNTQNSITYLNNLDQLINESFDCAIVATPSTTHFEIVKKLLTNKKHVLVEKPVTLKTSEVEELIKISNEESLTLLTNYIFLYNKSVQYLIDAIGSPEFGEVLYLKFNRTNLGPVRTDVNAIWDLMTHDVSILNAITEEMPEKIDVSTFKREKSPVAEVASVNLKFKNFYASFFVSWLHPKKERTLEIVGDNKMLIFDDISTDEPIKIYDKKINSIQDKFNKNDSLFNFSVGDTLVPFINSKEPLKLVVEDFKNRILGNDFNELFSENLMLRNTSILEEINNKIKL